MIDKRFIDWKGSYGIDNAMISDKERNQFYDRVMKDSVKDKNCIEIGYGLGTLSMIALTNGAKRIRAFEYNPERYAMAKLIVKELGLEDKIFLYNKRFEESDIESDDELIFHEILDNNAWGEGVYTQFFYKLPIIPGKITGEFYQIEMSEEEYYNLPSIKNYHNDWNNFYSQVRCANWPDANNFFELSEELQDICSNQFHWPEGETKFDPGVEFSMPYKQLIDEIIDTYNQGRKTLTVKTLSVGSNFSYEKYGNLIKKGKKVLSYTLDANTMRYSVTKNSKTELFKLHKGWNIFDLTIDYEQLKNKISIIIPSFEIEHNGHKLRLNSDRHLSHWFTPDDFAIIKGINKGLRIRSNLITGRIKYIED